MEKPPAELKFIYPFVKRGEEMKKVDKVVFYYCYFWAVKSGLELQLKSKKSEIYLEKMMEKLELVKEDPMCKSIIQDEISGKIYMEKFAEQILRNADEDIRMKRISLETSKKFLAAVNFFEVLKIWGELSPDILYKLKYSKICAVDIIKACKNCQDPNDILFQEKSISKSETLSNLNEKEKNSITNDSSLDNLLILNYDLEKKDTSNNLLNSEIQVNNDTSHRIAKSEHNQPALPNASYSCNIQAVEDKIEKIEKAQKHARWAISALNFEDIHTAMSELRISLDILESI
ncbi:hypothetical protein T552_01251 [Pneumocystis carinii B80]|uniref:Vta1/callose synthase N-terminal domain-containing protein n=1 Tax=Pneumocystis carinii (strain B80) TaxID=1408658 RepID=A0A0W4ZLQ6_PNEC8|nr:hypothetical protein T552_01251 [Pneumocystis carinii B80]KTW29296.1 hypothetical protein T552_01251 [Pneumocystis carinii B80]